MGLLAALGFGPMQLADVPLATTFEWLAAHVKAQSAISVRDAYGGETWHDSYRWVFWGNAQTCEAKLVEFNTATTGGRTSVTLTFNLKSLAINTAVVGPGYLLPVSRGMCRAYGQGLPGHSLVVATAMHKLSVDVSHKEHTSDGKVFYDGAQSDAVCISFADATSAERALNALRSACRACSCTEEPF